MAPFYIFTAFIFAYAVDTLKMSRDLILAAVLAASCVSFVTIPLSGHISDRIGRRKMYVIGAATIGVFGFLYFAHRWCSSRSFCRSFHMTCNGARWLL
jgi:MFS family permease